MDLKRLQTFVVVADLGTVSKAALRLRISQSALSRQISDLEYECGFKLFDRVGRRLFRRQHECRLGEIHLLRDRLHRLGGQPASVENHRELIAAEQVIGEDIVVKIPV